MTQERTRLIIADDESLVRTDLREALTELGYLVVGEVGDGQSAVNMARELEPDVVVMDIKMPGMDGIELLEKVKAEYPDTMVIIITAYGSIESAVKAMRIGASDYLLKPFKPDQLALVMERASHQKRLLFEHDYLKGRLEKITRFDNIIGQSPAMEQIFDLIPEVAQSDSSVLLIGETGTGKELIAKAIHAKSRRAHLPFIAINCGALPDTLLESELFGHQKGVFTGATHARKGFLEVVSGGTLFLDEIGEISPKMQIDLLRVLEEKKITSIGSREPVDVDFRLISATSQDLGKAITDGSFREDFFYRINVIMIDIPPLKKRKEDIPLLIQHFLEKYGHETTKQVDRVTRDATELLKRYDWPGNVRELENAVERAVVLSQSRTLGIKEFAFLRSSPASLSRPQSLQEVEKQHIQQILEEYNWNVTQASKALEINRVTLHKKIKRFNLERRP